MAESHNRIRWSTKLRPAPALFNVRPQRVLAAKLAIPRAFSALNARKRPSVGQFGIRLRRCMDAVE